MSAFRKKEAAESAIVPGTITSMAVQIRRPERVSVHLDGAYAFSIPADLAMEFSLRKGMVLDDEKVERLRRANALRESKQRALSMLATRPRSEAELRTALGRGAAGEDVIDETISRLEALGYIDDRQFAHSFASARARSRGYGPRRIHAELRRRGIADELAQDAIRELVGQHDPFEMALSAAERVWPRYARDPDARKRSNRLYGYLTRRGFDTETILRVLRRLEDRDT